MTDGKLKIAQVVGNAALGGVSSCVFNYYKHIDRSRVVFDFYTYGESPFDEKIRALDPDARIFTVPSLTRFYKSVPALTRFFREQNYDAVHSHMTTLSAFVLHAAKKAGVPVRICHSHSAANRYADHKFVKDVLKRFAAKDATHLMACGGDAAKYLFGKDWRKAFIMKNAVELDAFSDVPEKSEAKAALGLSGTVLGFMGRFAYQKNLYFLLDAFSLAAKEDPSLTLVLVGDGDERENLVRYAEEKCGGRVRFFPPTKTPALFYAAMDAFLLPSRYEGLPVVAIEAQAAGVPCLFSDLITRECSFAPQNAFLPLSTKKWAEAMQKIPDKCVKEVDILRAEGYDIRTAAERLAQTYFDFCGECE